MHYSTYYVQAPLQTLCIYVCVLVAQSSPTFCDPVDCSPPGSSVHGILQERILEWTAIPFSRGSSQPRDQTQVSCIAGRLFTIWATGKSCIAFMATFNSYSFMKQNYYYNSTEMKENKYGIKLSVISLCINIIQCCNVVAEFQGKSKDSRP